MDQGSTRKRSAVHNFAPTVTKFCAMWEGQALPHDTKFGNCRCKIVGRRVIFICSLIHGSSWSGLIKYTVLLCLCSHSLWILGNYLPIFVRVKGIDHYTVCAGVVGTAIRNSTSCAACGRAGRHNECCSGLQYQPRQRRPYKWSISILPRSQFTKSKGNLRFRRLVPLFVPIGVCVTTHDDGTASDVTIGMWRHNQQVTNHERNGKPWFSLPK